MLIHWLPNVMSRNQCETESWKEYHILSQWDRNFPISRDFYILLSPPRSDNYFRQLLKLSNDCRFQNLFLPSHKVNTCLCFLWPWNIIFPFAYWQSFHRMSWHTAVCKEPAHTKYSSLQNISSSAWQYKADFKDRQEWIFYQQLQEAGLKSYLVPKCHLVNCLPLATFPRVVISAGSVHWCIQCYRNCLILNNTYWSVQCSSVNTHWEYIF